MNCSTPYQFASSSRRGNGFCERVVGLDEDGRLAFGLGTGSFDRLCCPLMRPSRRRDLRACAGALGGHAGRGFQTCARRRHRADPSIMAIWSPASAIHCRLFTGMNSTPAGPPGRSRPDQPCRLPGPGGGGIRRRRPCPPSPHPGRFLLGLGLIERAGALGAGRDSLTQAPSATRSTASPAKEKAGWAHCSRCWRSAAGRSA
jgi:hypothetical protein